jgi:GH15 family glucan-1,4-alpha-glucosidase
VSGSQIADYALLGDLQSAALVSTSGSIDWLCLPRFDSPAMFAGLLGGPDAGHWRIAPAGAGTVTRRRYRDDTLVLESEWETADGTVRVLDLMPPRGRYPDVVRIVEGVSGTVSMCSDLVVRFDYGKIVPWVQREGSRWTATAGPDRLWLDTPVPLTGRDRRTKAEFRVSAGDRIPFVLTWAPSYHAEPDPVDADRALADTEQFWRSWMAGCSYTGPYADAVRRSLVTLKALTYGPSGAIAAAATTSLPEHIGGSRNWDYRYCWLRDASLTLQALAGGGFVKEAAAWRDWLLRAIAGDPADLQIMYSLTGRRRLQETELDWLPGYENSRPVRIGNDAHGQFQLDVYGEVLDGLHTARSAGLSAEADAWELQRTLTEHLESVWQRPDRSLWEIRGPERQFVHSKVMAWVGFDRMITTAKRSGLPAPIERWEAARGAVHAEVCARGFDADRNTFTQFYGSKGLDAALLLIPRVGFLPPDDPRVRGTIEAVRSHLLDDGLLLRYRPEADPDGSGSVDGLPGAEGAFVICSFWLADALALTGRAGEAEAVFERLLSLRNDVGLLSEQWDPRKHQQLGNTPQAFSHIGLVNSALTLAGATPPAGQ